MKNQFKFSAMAIAMMAITFTSCEKETEEAIENDLVTEELVAETREAVTDAGILGKIREDLKLDAGAVTKGDFHLPDGTVQERIYIGEDIVVTAKELEEMTANQDTRQFRTNNLVTGANRTVDIIGYTGNDNFGLSSKGRTALEWAVNNYNRISGSALRFRLTFGTNFNNSDMVVYDNTANNPGQSGGVAGFPSAQGLPNKFVQIYGLEGSSTNVNEHVITHEIGHSIGFRHSDYYDRASCGSGGGESAGSTGAIQLPGTPTRDFDSIMQACFSNNEDGEFSSNDVTALRAMY
ncbi:zinc-dependent metalloprotease [Dokdonia sp. Asnod3-C12]|uniref:zinc-dependent metalloprotease n=1 Tax=Dokdonia sp. Asnod3-C12 TaxID=3160575 RepID=UPI0038670DF6